ncbi:MAG: RNA polymerase sigma factor [Sedimentisphaerales bacterium]|nr:RNA polymerase sigma factor [Sedimentisphaerales bacterium]
MEQTVDHVRLVERAQLGDKECLDRLAELAEERLRVDIFRLTLQEDVAQEIVQESMFEMFRMLDDLKEAHRFWPWLYRIAINKMRLYYRAEKRRRTVTASAVAEKAAYGSSEQAMAGAISTELKDIVLGAMRRLKPRYRTVLTMRCYREMEYSQIAESMGCSEFAARMLFYRAKKSLRKQLSRFGFGKGMLLPALVLFGRITARSEAAASVSVSVAAMKVGIAAGAAGLATSTTGIVSLAVAGALTVGATTVSLGPVVGGVGSGAEFVGSMQVAERMGTLGQGNEELWCYYPDNTNGPVMMRLLRWDSGRNGAYCKWLQNEQATYYYDEAAETVHIENHRIWREDLSVWRLPTDPPELSEFLSRVERRIDGMRYVRGGGTGLLVICEGRRAGSPSQVSRHSNVLDEQYFLYGWSARTKRLDNRDAMHKRGWTYFRVSGGIGEEKISGTGRLPFVDAARAEYGAWLKLDVGDGLKIGDNGEEARIYEGGRFAASYAGGSFFAGLSRPWMGLHTIDTIRRDAAEKRIWFETEPREQGDAAEVVLARGETKLSYAVNLDKDIIERIEILSKDGRKGELLFSYLDEVDGLEDEFAAPVWKSIGGRPRGAPGVLWLMNLADGNL